jgi:hypothetical protein
MAGLKRGDVVISKVVVTDLDTYGAPYLHAIPGTFGVVENAEDPGFPCVCWGLGSHGGVCNVRRSDVLKYDGRIFKVCG